MRSILATKKKTRMNMFFRFQCSILHAVYIISKHCLRIQCLELLSERTCYSFRDPKLQWIETTSNFHRSTKLQLYCYSSRASGTIKSVQRTAYIALSTVLINHSDNAFIIIITIDMQIIQIIATDGNHVSVWWDASKIRIMFHC